MTRALTLDQLEAEAESTCAATMAVDFDENNKPVGSQRMLNTHEKMAVGSHTWSIDVPPGVGGYIELDADSPKVGDKLTIRVRVGGELIGEQSESLTQPLPSGTAFFVQYHFDDYSQAKKEMQ